MERSPVRNIQVFNPTTNTLNVRWEAATGPVQQYRVVYAPLTGARPSESVSFHPMCGKNGSMAHTCIQKKKHLYGCTSSYNPGGHVSQAWTVCPPNNPSERVSMQAYVQLLQLFFVFFYKLLKIFTVTVFIKAKNSLIATPVLNTICGIWHQFAHIFLV